MDRCQPAVRWRATKAFRFTAVSASPCPFDRFVGGWSTSGPRTRFRRAARPRRSGPWRKAPRRPCRLSRGSRYGALGFIALDPELDWTDAGLPQIHSRKPFQRERNRADFPRWRATTPFWSSRDENVSCGIRSCSPLDHSTPGPRDGGRAPSSTRRPIGFPSTSATSTAFEYDGTGSLRPSDNEPLMRG